MINVNRKILPPSFYVAVSGGVDSIVGLHLLHRLGYDVRACHFNHNFQSLNNVMQKSVEWICDDLNIPLRTEKRINRRIDSNVENELRKERLKFFNSLDQKIVCCHHLNDATENYTFNFLKGCPEYFPIQEDNGHNILRPFLRNRKILFEEYAKNNGLMKYVVEDSTNNDLNYRRNWIRNQILPQFDSFGLEKVVLKKFYLNKN